MIVRTLLPLLTLILGITSLPAALAEQAVTANGGAEAPPSLSKSSVRPSPAGGETPPSLSKSSVRPSQARGETPPSFSKSSVRPSHAGGETPPSLAKSSVWPSHPGASVPRTGGARTARANATEPADVEARQQDPDQTPPDAPPPENDGFEPLEFDEDLELNRAQPDFTVVALPTTLRLPRNKTAFRVTHRFMRPLGEGDFGDLASDFFGFDSGAQIGLEVRYGLIRGGQVGIHRTSDRTIQFFGQYDLLQQRDGPPLGLAVFATAEGTNNFRDSYSPGIGLVISREIRDRAAFYAHPLWVSNTNVAAAADGEDNDTLVLGLGGRLRLTDTLYLVGEVAPQLTGFSQGTRQGSVGLEGRVGGHAFQVNFSNSFGTTLAQVARGTSRGGDWFLGFGISRKFY